MVFSFTAFDKGSSVTNSDEQGYHGWKNYQTWNVVLWIDNDEGLYHLRKESDTYESFVQSLRETSGDKPIGYETPDGVPWTDSALDLERINEWWAEKE